MIFGEVFFLHRYEKWCKTHDGRDKNICPEMCSSWVSMNLMQELRMNQMLLYGYKSPTGETGGGGGTINFLAVCQSVRPSVRPYVRQPVCPSVHSVSVHSVFRNCLSRPLRYWLEIWYMNLSWQDTSQARLSSRLTYFYFSKNKFSELF